MKKEKPVQVKVNSCVGIDAVFFREMNPNYSRPCVEGSCPTWVDSHMAVIDLGDEIRKEKEQVRCDGVESSDMMDDDYLTCCPSVPGFSFTDNAFCKAFPPTSKGKC